MPGGSVEVPCRSNDRFCAKCCLDTKMPLTREDIERIKSRGYPEWYFVTWDDVPRLRNVEGRCVFLGEDGSCSIYEDRPLGCRLYPLVYDPERGVILDDLCPRRGEARYDESDVKALISLIYEVYGGSV